MTNAGSTANPLMQDSGYTLNDTFGCSCEQILFCKPGENRGEQKFGCTSGTMSNWMSQSAWSLDCQVDGKVMLEGEQEEVLADADADTMIDLLDTDDDGDGTPDSEDSEEDSAPGADGKPTGKPDWWCTKNPTKC